MQVERLRNIFSTSPVLQIFRADRGALIIAFFSREFKKENHIVSRPQIDLVRSLADLLADTEEDADNPSEDRLTTARRYLDEWTAKQYLIKTPNDIGEHWFKLTPESEIAINWVEDLIRQQRFVNTGSRLKDIFSKIKAIVEESNDDPETRIKELQHQQNKLQRQIDKIKETGKVETLNNTQIEEQFFEVNRLAKTMLSDFREVERNFREIADEIYRRQSTRTLTKGSLLGVALDALDELRKKDQGKSFYAFWELLRSDEQTDEFNTMVKRLYSLLEERQIPARDDRFLFSLKRNLNTHGKQVLASNDKLIEKLKRILAERSLQERIRTRDLIDEIRQLAFQVVDNTPDDSCFISVETFEAELNLPLARGLNLGEDQATQRHHPLIEDVVDTPDFKLLYDQFYVDRKVLTERIKTLLKDKNRVSLAEIVAIYPIEKGLTEVITYFSLAANDTKAQINDLEMVEILLNANERKMRVPQLYFSKS